ncbi:hypothetical protein A2U01_0029180, partial [Trifolium medium]|nr:hypothetical protein [Trifolium medium]
MDSTKSTVMRILLVRSLSETIPAPSWIATASWKVKGFEDEFANQCCFTSPRLLQNLMIAK